MWTRAELKQSAKDILRRNYWMPFAVSLVYSVINNFAGGGQSAPSLNFNFGINNLNNTEAGSALPAPMQEFFAAPFAEIDWEILLPILVVAILVFLFAMVVGIVLAYVLQFFVIGPITVGKNRWYMENRGSDAPFGALFYAFKTSYLKNAWASFTTSFLIELWTLLFVIPGIIYSYKWYQVPYILAENPNLSGKRAREISDAMTYGEKGEMFVLGLSFIGWSILAALCCGLGTMFLVPYIEATFAELYARQREKVLASGKATAEELPGFGRVAPEAESAAVGNV